MNIWIEKSELNEIKEKLVKWSNEISKTYKPDRKIVDEITEQEFLTIVKRVANLEIQNKENAKLKLSDFSISDIVSYLIESKAAKEVLWVDSSHEYEITTNFSHVHGSGNDRIIIVY